MTSADPNRQKLTQLRKLLIQHFSLDELRVLCFDLGLEYEELPGNTRTTKIHGLIQYLLRHDELPQLLNEAMDHRPNVAWPSFEGSSKLKKKDRYTNSPQSFFHEKSGLAMLQIPAGEFLFGPYRDPSFLPNFWIAKTPVTNKHYARFVQETGYKPPTHWKNDNYLATLADHPIVHVSLDDAEAYAQWAGLQLPTEQQWEKAARGHDGRDYPWGDDWKPYCNTREAGIGTTTPVGYYSPFGDSPYGCVDMSGNIWEWISSWHDKDRVAPYLRGGSFGNFQSYSRVAFWVSDNPDNGYNDVGFRVAKAYSISDS